MLYGIVARFRRHWGLWKICENTMRTIYGIKTASLVSAYPANFTVRIFRITTVRLLSKSGVLPPTVSRDMCAPAPKTKKFKSNSSSGKKKKRKRERADRKKEGGCVFAISLCTVKRAGGEEEEEEEKERRG